MYARRHFRMRTRLALPFAEYELNTLAVTHTHDDEDDAALRSDFSRSLNSRTSREWIDEARCYSKTRAVHRLHLLIDEALRRSFADCFSHSRLQRPQLDAAPDRSTLAFVYTPYAISMRLAERFITLHLDDDHAAYVAGGKLMRLYAYFKYEHDAARRRTSTPITALWPCVGGATARLDTAFPACACYACTISRMLLDDAAVFKWFHACVRLAVEGRWLAFQAMRLPNDDAEPVSLKQLFEPDELPPAAYFCTVT